MPAARSVCDFLHTQWYKDVNATTLGQYHHSQKMLLFKLWLLVVFLTTIIIGQSFDKVIAGFKQAEPIIFATTEAHLVYDISAIHLIDSFSEVKRSYDHFTEKVKPHKGEINSVPIMLENLD
jgi:hypothetical protein